MPARLHERTVQRVQQTQLVADALSWCPRVTVRPGGSPKVALCQCPACVKLECSVVTESSTTSPVARRDLLYFGTVWAGRAVRAFRASSRAAVPSRLDYSLTVLQLFFPLPTNLLLRVSSGSSPFNGAFVLRCVEKQSSQNVVVRHRSYLSISTLILLLLSLASSSQSLSTPS